MAFTCDQCGFNYEELQLSISGRELLAQTDAFNGERVRLYCPACGAENWLELQAYGVFSWMDRDKQERKLYRWHSAATRSPATGVQLEISNTLRLSIPEERIAVLNEKEVCYAAVPVFRQLGGRGDAVPRWPVRKEYLELLDMERSSQPLVVQDKYQIKLYFKGLRAPLELNLPLVPVRAERQPTGTNAYFEGVHLMLWPRVPYKEWRRYFIRFGCAAERADDLKSGAREVKIAAYASPDIATTQKQWVPVAALGGDNSTRFGCVESWPEWVAIEFEHTGRQKIESGGIWATTAPDYRGPTESYNPEDTRTTALAVDFGTSNTCIAVKDDVTNSEQFVPVAPCDVAIIYGADLPAEATFADTWPPRHGFGRSNALLPTEILTREPLDEVRRHAELIKRWKPVVDYGIPGGGVKVKYEEDSHTIAEFKWAGRIQDSVLKNYTHELQQSYLEFLLLFALAQLAKDRRLAPTVHVKFSYPLAFEEDDKKKFVAVLDKVRSTVSQLTGLKLLGTAEEMTDEARAAASSITPADVNAFLYVDVGGGSTDIALDVPPSATKKQKPHEYKYVASFQYAGGALIDALDGGKCLSTNVSVFRRKIREVGDVKQLLHDGGVFHQHRASAIRIKTTYFYDYLMEFLARLLAAHIITGEWLDEPNKEERAAIEQRGTYSVALYPLGNGWGFGNLFDSQYPRDVFARDLTKRTSEILNEARGQMENLAQLQVQVEVPANFIKDDPKFAVVEGLLRGESIQGQPGGANRRWTFRTILGCTTKVGQTRTVQWYQPVTDRSRVDIPAGEENLPGGTIDCPENTWPAYSDKLYTPHQLDEDLNLIRRELSACRKPGDEWFTQSPMHVLLEKLFRPALKKLVS